MRKILQDGSTVVGLMEAAGPGRPLPPGAMAAVPDPAAWGLEDGGGSPSLLVFIKALDERLSNALQETVANVAGIFLQVGLTGRRAPEMVLLTLQYAIAL